ncbi:hypothetical protein JW998_08730 [candidate division KSB1 bacterium]|nr:hypothetical protein [candidate division KSB1 bacterium]
MDENMTATPEKSHVGGVDQIREIILGDSLSDIQAELESLKKQINELRRTIGTVKDEADAFSKSFHVNATEKFEKARQSVEEQQKNFETSMSNMMKTIKTQLKKLEENKVDKSKIGQVFMEWGQKINELQS